MQGQEQGAVLDRPSTSYAGIISLRDVWGDLRRTMTRATTFVPGNRDEEGIFINFLKAYPQYLDLVDEKTGDNLLHMVARLGNRITSIRVAEFLLKAGLELETQNESGYTALFLAGLRDIDSPLFQYFKEQGGNIHATNSMGDNLLHFLVLSAPHHYPNFTYRIEKAIKLGISPYQKNAKGLSPVMLAKKENRVPNLAEDIQRLWRRYRIEDLKRTPNHQDAWAYLRDTIEIRLGPEERDDRERVFINFLEEYPQYLNLVDEETGDNLLHMVARHNRTSKEVGEFLLKSGLKLEAQNTSGATALLLAGHKGLNSPLFQYLREMGGNIHATDSRGNNILHLLVSDVYYIFDFPGPSSNLYEIKAAIDLGISPHQENAGGLSPIMLIKGKNSSSSLAEYMQRLWRRYRIEDLKQIPNYQEAWAYLRDTIEIRLGPEERDDRERVFISFLETYPQYLNLVDEETGDNLLHMVARHNRTSKEVGEFLLKSGLKLEGQNTLGATALFLTGLHDIDSPLFQYFREQGGNIHATDSRGNNILHFLVSDVPETFDFLNPSGSVFNRIKKAIQLGISPHQKNAGGLSPIMLAKKKNTFPPNLAEDMQGLWREYMIEVRGEVPNIEIQKPSLCRRLILALWR